MAKISDDFSKLVLILNNRSLCHERKSDHNLSSCWISANINVPIRTLIISEGKSCKLYPLILPNTMNNVLLVHQPTANSD